MPPAMPEQVTTGLVFGHGCSGNRIGSEMAFLLRCVPMDFWVHRLGSAWTSLRFGSRMESEWAPCCSWGADALENAGSSDWT